MPEPQDPNDQGDEGQQPPKSDVQKQRDHIRKLEKDVEAANKRAETFEAELATFRRSAAFDGLNIPNTGLGKLFRDSYQGELTAEAIQAKATEYDLLKPPPAPEPTGLPTIPGVDPEAMRRMQAAQNGAPANGANLSHEATLAGLLSKPTEDNRQKALEYLRSQGAIADGH